MATSNKGLSGNYVLIQRWRSVVELQPDELLSSWLVRAALSYGCDPLVLTGLVWGKWRVWTIDVDRVYDDAILYPLAKISGMSVDAFKAVSLYPIASQITKQPPPVKEIWPWVLALGARNTKRSGGLQYCPQCLKEDRKPYYRREWRLAWHTVCEKHQCLLLDRCYQCQAPIEPHRLSAEDQHVTICATCKANLSHAPAMRHSHEALQFQKLTDAFLLNNAAEYQGKTIQISEWFEIADLFVSFLRKINRNQSEALIEMMAQLDIQVTTDLPLYAGGVELLSVTERHHLLSNLYHLMMISHEKFIQIAIENQLTKQAFCEKGQPIPQSLRGIYQQLVDAPKLKLNRVKRTRYEPRPRHEVQRMMAKLVRKLAMSER